MTLEQAKEHLTAWLDADLAVATGKSYKIGSRSLTRVDITEIKDRIFYWQKEVDKLSGKKRSIKAYRVIPRDL